MSTPDTHHHPAVTLLLAAHGSTPESLQHTLQAALSQRLEDCETVLLLPPDWSCGLPQLTEALAARLRILSCPRAGLAAAWNLGLQHAAGEYLAFLSAGCEPAPDYALWLYTQALFEEAQLCHGEYILPRSASTIKVRSTYGALAARAGSPLLCLGPLWTFLFERRFLAERQLRFAEDCGDEAGLPFLVQALLECHGMALCEGRVGTCDSRPPPALTAAELEQGLAACRAAAAALRAREGTHPAAVLAYALAWLLKVPLARLAQRSAAAGGACRALAAELQAACPPALRQPLEVQLGCWARERAAIRPPWYQIDFRTECKPPLTTRMELSRTHLVVLRELHTKVGPAHDDVYLLLQHLGDAYAVLCFITHLIRTNASRSPVIAVCTQGLLEMVAMTRPELPVVLLQPRELHEFFVLHFAAPQLNLRRWRLLLYDDLYRYQELVWRPKFIGRGRIGVHWLQTLADFYGCQVSDIDIPPLRLLPGASERALTAARNQGLATGRLVMLFPDTYSATLLGWEDFWLPLVRELLGRGCGIYVNLTRGQDFALPDGASSFELSVAEVIALAFEARRIIALRSGLTELLCQGPAQLDVISTHVHPLYFSLMHVPHVNRDMLREYDLSALGEQRCLELLMARPEA